jgi:hypothetical protein
VRSYLRLASVAGAFALSTVAIAPAMAATENQSGATALSLSIAGNGQDSGTVTATYADGKETKTGETQPAFPQPAQDAFKLGVLAQEATAKPGFSAACAGLAGDGGSVLNIGDSSCLTPGNALNGSLGNLDLASLITTDPTKLPGYSSLPAEVKTLLEGLPGLPGQEQFETALTGALNTALTQARTAFGDGGLTVDLDAIQGRCVVDDQGPRGDSTLTNAAIVLNVPGRKIPIVNLPTNPDPNTHLVTNLGEVVQLVVDAIQTSLTSSFGAQSDPIKNALNQITTPLITGIKTQLQGNLKPVEDNLIRGILNEQIYPTADSIKVRALHLEIGTAPALREQVGASLVDLQIGSAACAPVARTAAAVAAPEAAAPAALPTAVSAGYATMPGEHAGQGDDSSNAIVLGAFALLVATAAGFTTFRRLRG